MIELNKWAYMRRYIPTKKGTGPLFVALTGYGSQSPTTTQPTNKTSIELLDRKSPESTVGGLRQSYDSPHGSQPGKRIWSGTWAHVPSLVAAGKQDSRGISRDVLMVNG